jgi:hypothetical protein
MSTTRRELLRTAAVGLGAIGASGCALFTPTVNPTTGATTYGLAPAVVTFITNAVQQIASYAPTIESIAATAISLFPSYANVLGTIITLGSSAVNAVVSALTNLLPSAPPAAASRLSARLKAIATSASGQFVGYTKLGVPVFAQ